MGRSPQAVFAERRRPDQPVDEAQLHEALTVRARRRVRRDSTLSIDGQTYQTDAGFLAGRTVTVARCHLPGAEAPWLEHEERRFELRLVDPVANSRRTRPDEPELARHVEFDPPGVLLDEAVGNKPRTPKTTKTTDKE